MTGERCDEGGFIENPDRFGGPTDDSRGFVVQFSINSCFDKLEMKVSAVYWSLLAVSVDEKTNSS